MPSLYEQLRHKLKSNIRCRGPDQAAAKALDFPKTIMLLYETWKCTDCTILQHTVAFLEMRIAVLEKCKELLQDPVPMERWVRKGLPPSEDCLGVEETARPVLQDVWSTFHRLKDPHLWHQPGWSSESPCAVRNQRWMILIPHSWPREKSKQVILK